MHDDLDDDLDNCRRNGRDKNDYRKEIEDLSAKYSAQRDSRLGHACIVVTS
jgi:hypothetical protein